MQLGNDPELPNKKLEPKSMIFTVSIPSLLLLSVNKIFSGFRSKWTSLAVSKI